MICELLSLYYTLLELSLIVMKLKTKAKGVFIIYGQGGGGGGLANGETERLELFVPPLNDEG